FVTSIWLSSRCSGMIAEFSQARVSSKRLGAPSRRGGSPCKRLGSSWKGSWDLFEENRRLLQGEWDLFEVDSAPLAKRVGTSSKKIATSCKGSRDRFEVDRNLLQEGSKGRRFHAETRENQRGF